MSEQKPTQPAPSAFHHAARAANPAMLVHLFRKAASAVLSVPAADTRMRDHIRMDVIIQELTRRGLRELASDLNDEWMARACLARMDASQPVTAIVAGELAAIRLRVWAYLRVTSA